MTLPPLLPGTAVFIPMYGMFTVLNVHDEIHGEETCTICNLRHYFTCTNTSRAVSGMERARVRAPTKPSTADHIVQQLRKVPHRKLQGHWNRQRNKLEDLLKTGTLEKNLEVVRLLHDINQDRWKAARASFYQHALRLVVEELAYIYDESPLETSRTVVRSLNKVFLERLEA